MQSRAGNIPYTYRSKERTQPFYAGKTAVCPVSETNHLTILGLQSRFGDKVGQTTWNLTGVSPNRDWSSKRVKEQQSLE